MNCCRPLLRLFSIQNNHQSKKFPSSSRKPSPFLTCESVCAKFLPSTDTQLHKRDSAAMKILVEQPIAAPLANLNVQWNCSWAMTKQTSAVRNGSDSETSSNDPMLLPVTSIINVRYHTLNLILVRTASLSGDRWLQLLELSKSWLWWNPCYNSSEAPRGTNRKIPASQPTRRGRGMMVLEREIDQCHISAFLLKLV